MVLSNDTYDVSISYDLYYSYIQIMDLLYYNMINLSSLAVIKKNVRKLYIYFEKIVRNFTKIKTILNNQKYMNSRTFYLANK